MVLFYNMLLLLQKKACEISLILIILFTFLYICYSYLFIKFMTSILGKMLIVIIIIFYTTIDKIYGILVCLLAIVFYQMDRTHWISESFTDTSSLCSQDKSRECGCCGETTKCKKHKTNYLTVVDLEDNINNRRKSEFQKRNCSIDNVLTYKDIPVKKDMSSIVFPEIVYGDGICNPCDKNCDFSIV